MNQRKRARLWVPASAQLEPTHICRICQTPFFDDETRVRHVRQCVKTHEEKLRAESEVQHPAILDEYPISEPDYDEWARRRGWNT